MGTVVEQLAVVIEERHADSLISVGRRFIEILGGQGQRVHEQDLVAGTQR